MIKKGQVSTEYLVILAVVLVVALVVVFLVGGFSGLGSGSLETQSKNYWASASPVAIKTYTASGTTMQLELENKDIERITVTAVAITGATTYATSTVLDSGETSVINVTLSASCGSTGDPFTYSDVMVTYTKGSITGITQAGAKPLVGKCS